MRRRPLSTIFFLLYARATSRLSVTFVDENLPGFELEEDPDEFGSAGLIETSSNRTFREDCCAASASETITINPNIRLISCVTTRIPVQLGKTLSFDAA